MPLVPGEGIGCALLSPAQLGAGKAAAGPTGSCTGGQELQRESGNEGCHWQLLQEHLPAAHGGGLR